MENRMGLIAVGKIRDTLAVRTVAKLDRDILFSRRACSRITDTDRHNKIEELYQDDSKLTGRVVRRVRLNRVARYKRRRLGN